MRRRSSSSASWGKLARKDRIALDPAVAIASAAFGSASTPSAMLVPAMVVSADRGVRPKISSFMTVLLDLKVTCKHLPECGTGAYCLDRTCGVHTHARRFLRVRRIDEATGTPRGVPTS